MEKIIRYKITTESNLFIGGAAIPFEIGGIDQITVTDLEDYPMIPGSSIKGAVRNIVREDDEEADDVNKKLREKIVELYDTFLKDEENKAKDLFKRLSKDKEDIDHMQEKYQEAYAKGNLSIEYLFGINGFNDTPKLIFSDLLLLEKDKKKPSECFSIDMKNSIIDNNNDDVNKALFSNPRTYKTARNGLTFEGSIRLHKFDLLEIDTEKVCTYVRNILEKFNDGFYRLGNSKSRGYGKISVDI